LPSTLPYIFAGAEVGIVFAVIVVLAVLGSLLYLGVTTAKRFIIPWHDSVSKQ